MTAKQILRQWLAENNLKQVFKGLFFLANTYQDEQLQSNATFQSGRSMALEQEKINGTISQEEEHLQAAKIRQALLHLINGLPNNWTLDGMEDAPARVVALTKPNWKKYAAYFAAFVALSTGIAGLSYSLSDIFGNKETKEILQEVGPKASTTGKNSPAIITEDGDVHINYGEIELTKDSINNK